MNEEIAGKIVNAIETSAKLLESGAKVGLEEFLNYALFTSVFSLLQNLLWAVLGYVVYKAMKALSASITEEAPKGARLFWRDILTLTRAVVLPISIIIPVMMSAPQIKLIGKILLAPHVYAAEEGAKLLEGLKK